MSGYTGAGKKGIAQYEDKNRNKELDSPRIYALTQQHKHLKEMKAISNLSKEPIFTPIICDYPQGMLVNIPLYTDKMSKKYTKEDIYEMFAEHFDGSDIVKVRPLGYSDKMIGSNNFANRTIWKLKLTETMTELSSHPDLTIWAKALRAQPFNALTLQWGLTKKQVLI